MSHHPTVLGPSYTPLRGIWVRNKRTGFVGYITHVERRLNERPELWIVYPPARLEDGTRLKTWSASGAHADEVKKLKRERMPEKYMGPIIR